jgi:hypothetical protein
MTCFLVAACSVVEQSSELKHRKFVGINRGCADNSAAWVTSMTILQVSPEEFVGHCVEVHGYFDSGINIQLFLTKDHALILDYASSIMLMDNTKHGELFNSSCTGHYVSVIGKVATFEQRIVVRDIHLVEKFSGEERFRSNVCFDSSNIELL